MGEATLTYAGLVYQCNGLEAELKICNKRVQELEAALNEALDWMHKFNSDIDETPLKVTAFMNHAAALKVAHDALKDAVAVAKN